MSQSGRNLNGVLASLAGIVAICVTVSVPASALAAYDAKSTDKNILNSCHNFSVDQNGVLFANCNEWSLQSTVERVSEHSIDLDEKIGLKDGKLEYNQSKLTDNCSDLSVELSASKLTLKAICEKKNVGIRVDDRLTNVGLSTGEPGLYWSDTLGQAGSSASSDTRSEQ